MAARKNREAQKQSLLNLLARQIAPVSAYRLMQLVEAGDPLHGLSAKAITLLADEIVKDPESNLLAVNSGKLRLYSYSEKHLAPNTAARFEKMFGAIAPGREGSRQFEEWCAEVLRCLYGDQLEFMEPQLQAEEGADRPDVCAAIKGGHNFWDRLQNDYQSRFIVFEFKNSEKSPSRDDVRQAAGYLARKTNKMLAMVVARGEIGKPATSEARRHLESHNKKLILLETAASLLVRLRQKENKKDPTISLSRELNLFLMQTTR